MTRHVRSRRSPLSPLCLLSALCAVVVVALPFIPAPAHAQTRTSATVSAPAGAPCSSRGQFGYLHTCSSYIEDYAGHPVRLLSVNWYGFEANDFVAAGLNRRTYADIIATVKALGYNTLRIPFSNEMVETNPVVSALTRSCPNGEPQQACRSINGQALLGPNSDLYGLTSLQILKKIVDYAGAQGLYVILDDHRSRAGWAGQDNGLWYDAANGFPQSSFIADWQHMALLFTGDPALTGVDLFNEPHSFGHPTTCAAYLAGHGSSWGSCGGQSNPDTDWRAAAALAGNMILQMNPNLLIIVEGTTLAPDGAGGLDPSDWGTSLAAAGAQPVALTTPGRLVYSVHEYVWHEPNVDAATMQDRWTHLFGYLTNPAAPYVTPVWIGEFGTCVYDASCVSDPRPGQPGYWFDALVRYLNTPTYADAPPYGWSVWPLNGTSPDAYDFIQHAWVRRDGDPEPYGLLNTSWTDTSIPALQSELFSGVQLAAPASDATTALTATAPVTDTTAVSATTDITSSSAVWPPPAAATPVARPTPPPTATPAKTAPPVRIAGAVPWKAIAVPPSSRRPASYPLTARLTLPRATTVAIGRTLGYAVVLTNTSSGTVRFGASCPAYRETLAVPSGLRNVQPHTVVQRQYLLNCGGVRSIARGARVTFAMSFDVPAWVSPGPQLLLWSLAGSDSLARAGATAPLTVAK